MAVGGFSREAFDGNTLNYHHLSVANIIWRPAILNIFGPYSSYESRVH